MPPTAIVIGAGIAGLAAAHRLTELGAGEVMLLESSERLGGKVGAVQVGGCSVDAGPESFLARNPSAVQLCSKLGLADELVAPAPLGALLWVRGRLRPLPKDLSSGVPREMRSLARSGAVSPLGLARAALEPLLPVRAPVGDRSVGEIVRQRFGNEAFEAVVDPLLSGVHAGNADRLSADCLVPHLLDALRRGQNLTSLPAPKTAGSPFLTLRGGLGRLVDALAATLPPGAVRAGAAVVGVHRVRTGYRVELDSGEVIEGDAVVLAAPPRATASMVEPVSPQAADLVARIETVPVATVTFKYAMGAISLPAATGFLVPRRDGRLLVGCTFLSQKWPHLAHSAELIRCAVGRDGAMSWQILDDADLVAAVRAELREAAGISADPESVVIRRFPDGIPQYRVGHRGLVEEIETNLGEERGIAVAGGAYHGVGLPACIASGTRAAERVAGAVGLVAA